MEKTFQTVSHPHVGKGIDKRSSQNKLKPGYAEDIRNMDTSSTGKVSTRKGYQGHLGDLPIRAISYTALSSVAEIEFPSDVDLMAVNPGPIVTNFKDYAVSDWSSGGTYTVGQLCIYDGDEYVCIQDRGPTATKPDADTSYWEVRTAGEVFGYSGYNVKHVYNLDAQAGTQTMEVEVDSSSPAQRSGTIVGVAELTDYGNSLNNSSVEFDGTIRTSGASGSDYDGRVTVEDLAEDGNFCIFRNDYEALGISTFDESGALKANTFTIAQGTHGVTKAANQFLAVYMHEVGDTHNWYQIQPESTVINAAGDWVITGLGWDSTNSEWEDGSTTDRYFAVSCYELPEAYVRQTPFSTLGDKTLVFNDVTNPINLYNVWKYSDDGTSRELVMPDEVAFDESASTLTVTFKVGITGFNTELVILPGKRQFNKIEVTGYRINTANSAIIDVYGIRSDQINYLSTGARGGYVHGLSEHSSAGDNHLVAAFGGALFRESTVSDDPMPIPSGIYVDVAGTIETQARIAPFFGGYSNGSLPTDGFNFDEVEDFKCPIVKILNHGNGYSEFILPTSRTNEEGSIHLGVDAGYYVTISGAGNPRYNGTFEIYRTYTTGTNGYRIAVYSPDFTYISPADEEDCQAWASITTCKIEMTGHVTQYQEGDILGSYLFPDYNPTVKRVVTGVTNDHLWIEGVEDIAYMSVGSKIEVKRTANTLPLTTAANIVAGDMTSVNGYDRKFRVLSADHDEDTVTIDEEIIFQDWASDPTTVSAVGKWVAVHSPDDDDSRVRYFDTNDSTNQPRLDSASLNGSVFWTNYEDDILKYDGDSNYKAGIIPWNPHCSSWVDTDSTGKIAIPPHGYDTATDASGQVRLYFGVGAMPEDMTGISTIMVEETSGSTTTYVEYTVMGSYNDSTNGRYIELDDTTLGNIVTPSGTIKLPQEVGYYFKVQAIDRNKNVVASAVTNWKDTVVPITDDGAITHKLVGLPKFDDYDYDRIQLAVYRTHVTQTATAPFYKIRTYNIDYDSDQLNSIVIKDTRDNSTLITPDDEVSINLKGAELPYLSNPPLQSKYLKTAGSKMIQGNVKAKSRCKVEMFLDDDAEEVDCDFGLYVQAEEVDAANQMLVRFKTYPLISGVALNTTNVRHITEMTFPDTDTFTIKLSGAHSNMAGSWIQIQSLTINSTALPLDTEANTADLDYRLAKFCGWWEVASADGTHVTVNYAGHGETVLFTFDAVGTDTPLYCVHADFTTGLDWRLPILTGTLDTGAATSITSFPFDSTTSSLEYATPLSKYILDIRRAFSSWAAAVTTANLKHARALVLSGSSYGIDTLILETTESDWESSVYIESGGNVTAFCNDLKMTEDTWVDGVAQVFPSRLLLSGDYYPEMFDNPLASSEVYSDSIVNVSPDDGQEITGIETFFGISSTGASQVETTVIVFKDSAVYAVDVKTRSYQKIESLGQGCTIPGSIASVQDGIFFANESGIYKVTRNLNVEYVGEYLEDYWNEDIGSDVNVEAFGFADSKNREYRLGVPTTDSKNDDMVVFDFITTDSPDDNGAWTIYDNFPATVWKQTTSGTYFGTYGGRIHRTRDLGDATDYRDDSSAISSSFTYGAQSFGDSGTRVNIGRVITHFKSVTDVTNVILSVAEDMEYVFTESADISFKKLLKKIQTIGASLPEPRVLFVQIKYEHSVKDEQLVISGIDFEAQALNDLGIPQVNE